MAGFGLHRSSWRISPPGTRVRVAIAVTDDAVGRIHQMAAACRALGFEHDLTLKSVGVLTGSADRRLVARLRALPGVLAVETRRDRRRDRSGRCVVEPSGAVGARRV